MTTSELSTDGRRFFVAKRVRQSIARHGVFNTMRRAWRTASGMLRERRLGIRTVGSVDGREMAFDEHSFGYQPVPYASFDAAMRHVEVRPNEDVFIDFGCGLGRAVVLAATYPFRRVIGVERSDRLSEAARENIAHARHKLRCDDVRVVTEDARAYDIPNDATHIFMFNPFDEPILLTVLARLRDSLHVNARNVTIIYALPKTRHNLLSEIPWLSLKHEITTIDSDWQRLAIYENR